MTVNAKTLIIGLDGGTFTILKPLMDEGHLPVLKKIAEQGVCGELESTVPPLTGPAWSSFQTGLNPGRHGIYDFVVRDPATGAETPINHSLISGRSFWDHAGAAGKTCLILNVPVTYPPAPVNGALIADFLTPSGKRDFMHPAALVEEIEARFGPYPLYMQVPAFAPQLSDANTKFFLHELNAAVAYKFDAAEYLHEKYGSDLMVLHVFETDRLQHELWHLLDKKHLRFDQRQHDKFHGEILRFYSALDGRIGRLLERFGPDSNVLVVSDHGFARANWLVDINAVLLEAGLIALKKKFSSRVRHLLWRCGITLELAYRLIIERALKYFWRTVAGTTHTQFLQFIASGRLKLFLTEADIDWPATKAVGKFFNGAIFVSRAGVLPQGSLVTDDEIAAVRRRIEQACATVRNPETGQPVGGELVAREQAFTGEHALLCPEYIYLPGDDCHAGTLMGFYSNKPVVRNVMQSGHHTRQGILIAAGPDIAHGTIQGARLVDIGPTALHLLGLTVPAGLDGVVLSGLFSQEFAASRPVTYGDAAPECPQAAGYSEEDQRDILDKLKGLGYI